MARTPEEILKIAAIVRREAESMSIEDGCDNPTLAGCCGDVSAVFTQLVGQEVATYEYGSFRGEGHAWVSVGEKIVDLTATQFGRYPRVRVVSGSNRGYRVSISGSQALHDLRNWGCRLWRQKLYRRSAAAMKEEGIRVRI